MKTNTNPTCATCPKARNQVNGRYCRQLKRYVEYEKQPLCQTTKQN